MSESPLREARIDLGAVKSNLAAIAALVAPAEIMAVVKADAYGHGMLPVAAAAIQGGASWLGVVDLTEALALRDAGLEAPILAWLHGADADFAAAVEADIDLGISSLIQLERAAAAGRASVQLKLDTGLSRNGIAPEHALAVFERAAALEDAGRIRVRGIFSHLANASRADDDRQLERFAALVEEAEGVGLEPGLLHIASTQAAIQRPDARFDLVRIGIGMYGLRPADTVTPADLGLRPVMELVGQVAAVRRVPAGSGVSYGFIHRTTRPTTLALVPLGYADGIPRAASGRAHVAIGGVQYPVVGRIAMDQFLVDVGDAAVSVGDRVVLWGDPADGAPSADDWGAASDSIGYEIVTRVGPRVPRSVRE